MILGQVQHFASPEEALKHYSVAHISEKPWSDYTKADYSIEQWHAACSIHVHDEEPTSKSQCKLPVKTPNGALNRNGVHAAAAALAGARGGLKGVSDDQKQKAAKALKRYYAQLDEDPPESLAHYGVKGMRWGHRKAEETSDRGTARRNEAAKQRTPEGFATGNATPPRKSSSGRVESVGTKKEESNEGRGGLSPTQKKALLAAGVGVVAIGGYVAYRHYAAGRAPEFDLSDLAKGPLSKTPLGKLDHGHPAFRLKNTDKLMVDTSKGYADIRSINGFPNDYVKGRHAELISTFEEMREKYPAVRNLKVEVVPMSHAPGMEGLAAMKSPAAVMSIKKGEARLLYNDLMDGLSPAEAEYVKSMQPGVFTKKFLGYHEMGHMLAVAHGDIPPAFDAFTKGGFRGQINWGINKSKFHKQTLKKHGFSFKQLSKLSKYAATEPAEALAELSGHYFTPEFRAKMSPGDVTRAKALFDEMGGVT
jgi:hypothetical protein